MRYTKSGATRSTLTSGRHYAQARGGLSAPKRIRRKQTRARVVEKATPEAKVLGCYLEANGSYKKERGHRISRTSMVWQRLKRTISRVKVKRTTKGSLLRSSVIASILYGVDVRSPTPADVRHMQHIVDGYEKCLFFSQGGGSRDMVGKMTQPEIRESLGTLSIQLTFGC